MPTKELRLSELKEGQYFRLDQERGSKRFKYCQFADNKHHYLDSNEKRATAKDHICYTQISASIQ